MEKNENRTDGLLTGNDRQIQVVVNPPGSDEVTINLGNVFRNMKRKKRLYAWVLVLCMAVGLCAPLLLHQFSHQMQTVSSVVTLNYSVPAKDENGDWNGYDYEDVKDLTAPDGAELDLNQITSSYVLQNALNGLTLNQPLTLRGLRDNIRIERVLTEESRQAQELAAKMVEDKNNGAYAQLQAVELVYENKFMVTLTNGFTDGDPDSKVKTELTDGELRLLLDRILNAYNDYLVKTYADKMLPVDAFSVIDLEKTDILDSLEQMQTATDDLTAYCRQQTASARNYRSYRTGRTLEDWINTLNIQKDVRINYLYSYVYNNSIVRDIEATVTNFRYQLRTAQQILNQVNENIATVEEILKNYRNDEIYVSMQESEAARTTKTTTDYYNSLVLQQAENYRLAAKQEALIADLTDKLNNLEGKESMNAAQTEEISGELQNTLDAGKQIYEEIRAHMEEIHGSASFTIYAEHTAAQGKSESFLTANLKNIAIFAVLGAVLACGLWFLAGLAPEFLRKGRKDDAEKEAARA